MKTFYKKVPKQRGEMLEFLREHFRYFTMNSWNGQHSYANCVKISHLGLTSDQLNVAYDILDIGDSSVFLEIDCRMEDFGRSNDWKYQAMFNGRSNGYIVMVRGGKRPSEYTTRCNKCGLQTYYKEERPCTAVGCDGTLTLITVPVFTFFTEGTGIDQDKDYETWENDELRDRVKLVQAFDKLCDDCVKIFVRYCDNYKVVEREVMVPRKIKVLEEK